MDLTPWSSIMASHVSGDSQWAFVRYSIYYYKNYSLSFFKILFIFRVRRWEGEREGEKHQCVVASSIPPTGDLAHSPGMCPDWELNWQPFGSQAHT